MFSTCELKNHRYLVLPCVRDDMEPNGRVTMICMTGPLLCFALLGRGRSQQEHRTVVRCSMSDSKWSSSSLGNLPVLKRNSLQHPSVSFLSQILAFQEWICFTGQCLQAGDVLRPLKLANVQWEFETCTIQELSLEIYLWDFHFQI